jgi:hypothetical protein
MSGGPVMAFGLQYFLGRKRGEELRIDDGRVMREGHYFTSERMLMRQLFQMGQMVGGVKRLGSVKG